MKTVERGARKRLVKPTPHDTYIFLGNGAALTINELSKANQPGSRISSQAHAVP
jgi:type IV secretory pathway TrbF-like protein